MEKPKGILYLVGAFTLAGTSVVAARFVSQHLGTFTITAVSLFFVLLGLFPLCGQKLRHLCTSFTASTWLGIILQAIFGIFLFRLFLLQGLLHTSAGEAGILTGATPAVTAVLAVLFLKEKLRSWGPLGIISTVIGIMLLQGLLLPENQFSSRHILGNLLVLCAAFCESAFNVLSRLNSLRVDSLPGKALDPILQTFIVSAIAFLLCLLPAIFERPVSALSVLPLSGWLALLWYGLFATALAYIFFYAGIKRCLAATAAAFSGLMPFTSLVLSVGLLGESIDWQMGIGGSLIVLGMILT